ncbi:MAG: tRNA pseudouridine(38-40) synthase TruA [Methylococcaceae bacterium]|nr:tRNA pseudouridine(38-40) synthase TruA [Methylococcaceae bacterium]
MDRFVLGVEYDGSAYSGWQWQPSRRSIQNELEKALSKVADHPVSVVCAGRTDAGVHALEQIVHFDSFATRSCDAWLLGGNSGLPDDIRILWVKPIAGDFHARSSALARLYRYVIHNRSVKSALQYNQATWSYRPLDAELMHTAAQSLVGNHDFSSFRAKGCQSLSPFRHMYFIDVSREKDKVTLSICANAFLHHMVRNIAGVLMDIGSGKQPAEWTLELLAAKKREVAGVTAPPYGLYLESVYYPAHFGLFKHPAFNILPDDIKRFN